MSQVLVQIYLPRDVYRALSNLADRRHTQSHKIVEQLVEHALTQKPLETAAARIRRLKYEAVATHHRDGLNDVEIAYLTGMSSSAVYNIRTRMALPANAKPGRPKTNYNRQENAS